MRNKLLLWLACSLCCSISLRGLALPDDNQQPINIQANRATQQSLDGGERTEYFGDVVMTQGSVKVIADHLIIHSTNRQVTQIIASGNPARFQQQSDPDKQPVKARANNIDYSLTTETVILTENASIDQPEASFSGNHIAYNVATEEVIAEERVNMVFSPANTQPAQEQKTPQQDDKENHGETAGQ